MGLIDTISRTTREIVVQNFGLKVVSLVFALGYYGFIHGAHDAQRSFALSVVVLPPLRREQLRELSDAGLVQVQDATSAAVIEALDLQPDQRVLDRCAGRGTKTQQILERGHAAVVGRRYELSSVAARR